MEMEGNEPAAMVTLRPLTATPYDGHVIDGISLPEIPGQCVDRGALLGIIPTGDLDDGVQMQC